MSLLPLNPEWATLGDTKSWVRVAAVSVELSSVSSDQLLRSFSKCFTSLQGGKNPAPVTALSLALQLRGVPPVLRGVFPTLPQMQKSAKTRQVLVMADLLWLCAIGVKLHKDAGEVIALLRQQDYPTALSKAFRLSGWLEGLAVSRAFGQRDKVRALIRCHSNELVIIPHLIARQEQKIEPGHILRRLIDGGVAASALPDGGQARHLDLGLVFQALYAADCFVTGKGYAEAARYYNARALVAGKQVSRSYMRTLCTRMKSELPKALTAPIKPAKRDAETMV